MKRLIILFAAILVSQFCFAQPTQAEIDKMTKQAQEIAKKYGNDSLVKNVVKDAQKQQKQMTNAVKNAPGVKNSLLLIDPKDTAQYALPTRDTKLLNSLPIRTFNRAELVSYLHNLNSKLTAYIRSNYGTDINSFPETVIKQSGTTIGLWLNGNVNESALVTLKQGELNPDNNLVLNNTGGILTSSGLGYYAIPILEYALEKQPGNNMILNNLGQAYLDLGDDKKAEQYLLQCVSSYKYYPDANLALGYIYLNRGNKGAAINYAENSLRGAWSSKADNFLRKLKPDLKMMDYVSHRYKQPEYFNFQKYAMLPQCYSTDQIAGLEPQYKAYREMIAQKVESYHALYSDAALGIQQSLTDIPDKVKKTGRNPFRPFGTFGNVVLQALKDEYLEKLKDLEIYRNKYYHDRGVLNIEFKAKYDPIDHSNRDGKCGELNALRNSYLPLFAEQTELFQRKTIAFYKDYLNDLAYWSYVASLNDDQFHVYFYGLSIEFLAKMNEINTTRFMEASGSDFYPCNYDSPEDTTAKELEVVEPDCFLTPKLEVNLGAFKMEISCESYKLEAGEEIIGKIEYNRSSGDVTLGFGVGAATPDLKFHGPGIEAGVEAEAKSMLYITFDKKGTPTDLGILWEAELKAGIEMENIKETAGLEEGLTAGFGSGVQIKENSLLKKMIDDKYAVQPDDKQINKNVRLYK